MLKYQEVFVVGIDLVRVRISSTFVSTLTRTLEAAERMGNEEEWAHTFGLLGGARACEPTQNQKHGCRQRSPLGSNA